MKRITDITRSEMAPYRFAESILSGNYSDVLYYEFHTHFNSENEVYESNRLSSFQEESKDFYSSFICNGYPDEFEAVIDVAIRLGGQWFVMRECGANYYLGFGPQGILELRKACNLRKIPIIVYEEKIDNWISNEEVNKITKKQNDFELILNIIKNMSADFERRAEEYNNIQEESLRDRLLAPINGALSGRANAEAKNAKGKTDILVRTESGENEFIFELKIWKGIKSFKETIEQLKGYLVWNNNKSGILMINRNNGFSKVIEQAKKLISEDYKIVNTENEREIKFRFPFKTDSNRFMEVTVLFVNLNKT